MELLPKEQSADVPALWNRYVAFYRPLELAGTGWRAGHNKAKAWGELGFVFRAVAQKYELGEAAAVAALEERRQAAGSWSKLIAELRLEQPDGKGSVREALKAQLAALEPAPQGV